MFESCRPDLTENEPSHFCDRFQHARHSYCKALLSFKRVARSAGR